MKRYMVFLILFLLLLTPFSVMAKTGNIKILDKEGNNITADNFQENTDKNEDGGSVKVTESNESTKPDKASDIETYIKSTQTSFENALNGFTEGIINSLMEGSVTIFDTDVDKKDGTIVYDIKVRELNPFEHPLVIPMQLISFVFLILISIFTILGSLLHSAFQSKKPEAYGDWKRNASGEYVPYNPNRVHTACVWATTRPCLGYIAFIFITLIRNYLIMSMPQTASGVLSAATDNLVIRLISGIAIFVGAFQTSMGEYGYWIFGTLIFVMYMITDIVILFFNSPETAKKIEQVAWGAFGLFCFCDLINMFCTSFGVITSQWQGESIYITVGLVSGAGINFVLMLVLIVFAVLKGKKALGV